MLKIYSRAASDRDLKAMKRAGGSLGRNLITATLPVAALLFGGVYWKWRSVFAATLVAVGVLLASALSNVRFFREARRRENQKANSNAVEVLEVTASRVIDIEPMGDNGPAFCFFVESGKALLLVGQWLRECDSFPAEAFRLYCWSDTKKPIWMEVTGRAIEAEHSTVCLRAFHRFGKINLFDATPETLQADVDKALGRKW
ncbi:MAG TPA: hypothetical protein VE263_03120 [Candidatus Angelobacter sp.]|nr:hypothetical protein [Candidatus Angelobacter sp.]